VLECVARRLRAKRGFLDRDFPAAELGRELEQVRANPIVRMPSRISVVSRVLGLLSGVELHARVARRSAEDDPASG
jgi:hypothetical protein